MGALDDAGGREETVREVTKMCLQRGQSRSLRLEKEGGREGVTEGGREGVTEGGREGVRPWDEHEKARGVSEEVFQNPIAKSIRDCCAGVLRTFLPLSLWFIVIPFFFHFPAPLHSHV
jgi:hypothetical protein